MTIKKFYVGVKAILHDRDKGYLVLRDDTIPNFFWDNPGGRIDGEESFEQALTRELTEEVPGIKDIKIGKLLGAHRVDRDVAEGMGLVLLYYHVTAKTPENLQISDEHVSFRWISSSEEIPEEGLNPEVTNILQDLLR